MGFHRELESSESKQKMHKISPKRVKFARARVAFQVDYDISDDKNVKKKIPVWSEHWRKSKSSLLIQLLKRVSLKQWIRVSLTALILIILLIQIIQSLSNYSKRQTLITGQYLLESDDWPEVTLCTPIVIPIQERCLNNSSDCQTIHALFNQSLLSQVIHRCKQHVISSNKLKNCEKSYQWIQRTNQKCFSYSPKTPGNWRSEHSASISPSSLSPSSLSLLIQSVDNTQQITLFVHQKRQLPYDETKFRPIRVKPFNDLKITFFSTTIISQNNCKDYERQMSSQSECFAKCLLSLMRNECHTSGDIFGQNHCLSRLALIVNDLVQSSELFCNSRDDNHCNSKEYYSQLEDECRHVCDEDCTQQTYHLSIDEQLSSDSSEINVSISRQLGSPDLVLRHVPQTTCLALLSQLGGLCAFWTIVLWFCFKVLNLIQYFWEFIEIYYL